MTLKQKRKYVADFAKKANLLLKETYDVNPEFLDRQWKGVLTKPKYATKRGLWRQSTPYHMNTEQLNKFMQMLTNFVNDIQRQKEKKAEYEDLGFPNALALVERLAKEFYNYYYSGYEYFYDQTLTILENMSLANDITESEAFNIIETAFYSNGNPNNRPDIEDTNYTTDASNGGEYL